MAEEVAVAVAVCVRVRPVCNREGLEEATHVYWKTDNNAIYQIDGSKSFSFDRVFHSNETTKNVYDEIAVPIIDSAIQGYNGTVFAYGQTASGKTHTMMGSENCLGVIPRAIHDIFQKIKKLPEREFLLRVSYMEIYNETITDLLCNTQKVKPLIIREDINRNVYVADLTEEVVYTSEMALQWLSKGEKNRHYGITKMNQRSSRSHTIFRMILESREKGESSSCDGSIKVSHLNLVDLAGSERASQTGAEGVRLKEGCNINRSLFILGQVIKKLSDGQVGGFINYRDSKLTRILQNSLGGNAKTRIICTITPISFDETLSTLQFASTAKYMKNTPFVNEVSSDEALLKRYRKEIVDLKKQLEEVSVKTRVQEMEKDQLAQLLDEKDLLQKVQDEKIQNLKRMLVTSSSIALQQELKAKKKRRVTWCLGKVNKMSDSTDVNEFEVPTNVTTRTHKSSITVLGEIDESVCVETDTFSNTLEPLTETEWSSATTLLSQENLEGELNSLHAKYDNLVLDNEQLRRRNEYLELKLTEKDCVGEFETLERESKKDQEVELIHEISNLKDLVKHAKAYNQDLENELSSKVELLKDKEDQIKNLQKHINIQNSDTIKMDLSYSLETTEDLKQMKQDLVDTEAVVLYAKKKSTFLTSENLELKEKIKKLLNSCKQMEDDIQLYQRQLETEKKTQADLDKELQSSFNEIRKLNSLLDGKVPKDLLCNLELERKIDDLQSELNKEFNENETLRKEVKLLSELKPLPSEVQMLRTEIHKKSKELTIITSEKEKLISEVVHKDNKIQSLLEEMGKTKGDLAASQLDCRNIDEEFQNFKTLHMEFEQKYKNILEENEKMKQELSGKTQELQQETAKSQDRLDEVEQLKEELENKDSALRSVEKENSLLTETLQQTLEEVKTLTQEKDDLQQLQESLQIERDQLRNDIQDTINTNIDTQEQLRTALESLKKHKEIINTLKRNISENSSETLHTVDAMGQLQQEDLEKEDELRIAHVHLKEQQDTIDKLRRAVTDKTDELAAVQRDLEHANAAAKAQIQELKEKEDQLTKAKDDLVEFMYQMEQLKKQLKTQNSVLECADIEKFRLNKKLHENLEEIRFLTEENNNLKCEEETLRAERDQLRESLTKAEANIQELKENELQLLKLEGKHSEAQKQLKEQGMTLSKIEMENLTLAQKLHENFEEIKTLVTERDNLRKAEEILKLERDQFKENLEKITAKDLDTQQELKIAHMHLKEQEENIDNLRQKLGEKTTQISDIQKDLDKSKDELPTKNHKGDVKHKRKLLCDAEQHPTENLKEKCLKIKELLKKYSEMDNDYECLDRLSLDLEKEIETQKELSVRVKGNLYLPYSQTKQIQKLLAENQRCSVESFRVMKKLKYVLSHVTRIKEEQHDTINKFELAFVEEVEKQNELQTKIQCLDMDYNAPASRELKDLKLNPNIDEHIEEILKDFSEYDFQSIRTEFQQLLNDQKEMCQLLEEWLSAPFDIEKLKLAIQKENSSLFRVNNFYNDKITAIINESTEFEERSAIRSKDWKCDLNVMKEKTKKLVEDYQSLTASQSSARICSTTPSRKTQHVASGRIQMTAEKIQELETSLHEAKESAVRKEDKIVKLQEELKVTNDIIAKLENKVNESNKCLEKAKETIQLLQEEVAVGAKVYKEEIEDLKTKLVKTDLEKMKNGREHEKEMNSTKATIEYQKEMIRALRENLRRNQQAQDTSLTSEYDLQPPVKPLTCGGGSGIIQSTKALILKSEYVRLEKEMSKLKQQNEEITKQKNELLSENHHLSSVIKTWKERIFKSEAYKKGTCENSPESPKVTRTGTKKKLNTPSQYKEGNLRDIVLNESPKSSFFDSRSKSLPACYPVRYFDNSSLGLFPEEQTIETNSLDAKPDLWPSSSRKETDDCKMQ
uniref:centromere-associated protein E-like isoform X4 n=1 Tax=Jaculus jaculus TaxID=51337 RepID=UPI001E1B426B|nr:centromere-associated protein E-like isoform X4 [Jaculus jaculus]